MNQFNEIWSHSVPVSSSFFSSALFAIQCSCIYRCCWCWLIPISSWFITIKMSTILWYISPVMHIRAHTHLFICVYWFNCDKNWADEIQFDWIEIVIETACALYVYCRYTHIPCHSIVFRSLYHLDNRWLYFFYIVMLCVLHTPSLTRRNVYYLNIWANVVAAAVPVVASVLAAFYLFNFHLFIMIGQCSFFYANSHSYILFHNVFFSSFQFLCFFVVKSLKNLHFMLLCSRMKPKECAIMLAVNALARARELFNECTTIYLLILYAYSWLISFLFFSFGLVWAVLL